jgi:hypothetical protein
MSTPLPDPAGHPWDDVFVLREYQLVEGHTLDQTSRFRDEVWAFGPAIHQMHSRSLRLAFATIPHGYRMLAKELSCAYLAMPLPAGEDRLALVTVRCEFVEIKRFLEWLHDQRGAPKLTALTGADITAYAQHLRMVLRHSRSPSGARAAVRRIWRFRAVLPGDRLLFDPCQVEGWSELSHRRHRENRTDRLPEQVMGPLIAWATRFVDVFAPDLLAMTDEWARLRPDTAAPKPRGQCRQGVALMLDELLAAHVDAGRPLPGWKGQVNSSFLANKLRVDRTMLVRTPSYLQKVAETAAVVGIDDETCFYTPVRGELDGSLWLDKISNEAGDRSLPVLSRLLQTACYMLIAFYSGMRDGEVKHLRRGALRIERDPDGRAYRWKALSRAFKGERDRTGVDAVWVIGEPAARAIQVLEALQPAHTSILFQTLPYGGGWAEENAGRAMNNHGTNIWLNRFVGWVNNYCDQRGRADGIPAVNGAAWRLKTSQFRRTLAWFIARRPGGAIAGALAFRHHAIQMFEGYAGTSESGFRAEVESEQALARGEHLVELADIHRHTGLTGPAADEAARRLAAFGLLADGFSGTVISDDRRLERLMKRHDPAVYPGTYVTCVYRHETALCRRATDTDDTAAPELTDCKPLACRNVALTTANVDAWRTELGVLDRQLARRPRLPPLLEHHLGRRRDDIDAFLTRHARPGQA